MYTSLEKADDEAIYENMQYFFKNSKEKALVQQNVEWSDIKKFHSMPRVYWPLLIWFWKL